MGKKNKHSDKTIFWRKMKILAGTLNPIKIKAIEESFGKFYEDVEVLGVETESNVSKQPINEEVYKGAENRAENLILINNSEDYRADFFIGIEGGIEQKMGKWFSFGCMCIIDKTGNKFFGFIAQYQFPHRVVNDLLQGLELGDVIDKLAAEKNSKQKLGAVGYFTNGILTRKELYIPGLISAIIPFLQKDLYF